MNSILNHAPFRRVGGVSEVAIMAPIKLGFVPGERRSYEQRLRELVDSIQGRAEKGYPTLLSKVTSIHFGRIIVLRPEQYLGYMGPGDDAIKIRDQIHRAKSTSDGATTGNIDTAGHRSWALILVEFDGDPKVYFRDIADYVGEDFNRMFYNCEEFPGVEEFETFWAWLKRFQVPSELFYPIYNDITTVEIKALQAFKRDFDVFADKVEQLRAQGEGGIEALWDDFMRASNERASGFPNDGGIYEEGGA